MAKIVQRRYAPEVVLRRLARTYRDWERLLIALPREVNRTLEKIQQGDLEVRFQISGLDRVVNRLIYGIIVTAFVMGSTILGSAEVPPTFRGISVWSIVGILFALVLIGRLLRAIEKSGKL